MNTQELTALRMQKIYEFGEIEFERKLLRDRLDQLDHHYVNLAQDLIDLEDAINNSQETTKKSDEKLV